MKGPVRIDLASSHCTAASPTSGVGNSKWIAEDFSRICDNRRASLCSHLCCRKKSNRRSQSEQSASSLGSVVSAPSCDSFDRAPCSRVAPESDFLAFGGRTAQPTESSRASICENTHRSLVGGCWGTKNRCCDKECALNHLSVKSLPVYKLQRALAPLQFVR